MLCTCIDVGGNRSGPGSSVCIREDTGCPGRLDYCYMFTRLPAAGGSSTATAEASATEATTAPEGAKRAPTSTAKAPVGA